MANDVFQLTVLSQNDPECSIGSELSVVVDQPTGGTLTTGPIDAGGSFPVGTPVPLPIPPPPGATGPESPTWFLQLSDGIENASYSLTISGPDGSNPTSITIAGSSMPGWVAQNQKEDTNQIYLEATCGIFGYAQENIQSQSTTWIYTVTAGVYDPMVHPPV
ncbi:MAG: hypothetical protein ACJ8GN_27540 [Longimicrobiaceae bacterium]